MDAFAHLLTRPRRELRALLTAGHPIDPEDLAERQYLGISLGLPAFVERLTWKTFAKTFHRDGAGLRGWNVRLEQRGIDAVPAPRRTPSGAPMTFGHYRVVSSPPSGPVPQGLLLDYGRGGNPPWDPMRALRDPLVALNAGACDVLLGWSYLQVGGLRLGTPSYFVLVRPQPLESIAAPPRPPPA